MKTSTSVTLTAPVVFSATGSVDQEATMHLFVTQLTTHATEIEATALAHSADAELERSQIAQALAQVFDSARGERITMPNVCARVNVARNLPTEKNYKAESDKVVAYLQEHSGERGAAEFMVRRGRTGGVGRWSDLAEKPVAAPREKQKPGRKAKVKAEVAAAESVETPAEEVANQTETATVEAEETATTA